ncbi:MAG: hypothetical protein A2857_05000 [Candidatus Levybacteria bacterium RIFCSPHIGHO2_01_FULL_36_15]|nr:MAG: hypothetical protein A2857_05000 [Candidatus Levybacteria bacterium RIFCSPHIGHO2_01_FULL_36_15]
MSNKSLETIRYASQREAKSHEPDPAGLGLSSLLIAMNIETPGTLQRLNVNGNVADVVKTIRAYNQSLVSGDNDPLLETARKTGSSQQTVLHAIRIAQAVAAWLNPPIESNNADELEKYPAAVQKSPILRAPLRKKAAPPPISKPETDDTRTKFEELGNLKVLRQVQDGEGTRTIYVRHMKPKEELPDDVQERLDDMMLKRNKARS